MSDTLLEYSSWSFQLILFLAVLYLFGLIKPAWVLASQRRTVVIVSAAVMLLASTAFYIAIRPLDSAPDGARVINADKTPAPRP